MQSYDLELHTQFYRQKYQDFKGILTLAKRIVGGIEFNFA